jgi:hypothetical protein
VFADFDKNGHLDALFPACLDGPACAKPKLFAVTASDLFDAASDFKFDAVDMDASDLTFDVVVQPRPRHPYRFAVLQFVIEFAFYLSIFPGTDFQNIFAKKLTF